MTNPKVSVIVPCYNQEKYLGEALDSVIAQTYKNWECIIINDGSIDNSESIAKEYVRKDSRFKYIYQDNQGVVSARNNAIKQSCGQYILPLDGDDLIAEDYLELAVSVLEQDESICLVYCDVQMFGEKNQKMYLRPMNMTNILAGGCCVNASFFRRKDFDDIGGYKEYMHDGWEDWEFFISLLEKGKRVYKIEKTLFYYRIQNDSRDRSLEDKRNHLFSLIVKNHALSYFHGYNNLLHSFEDFKNNPLVRDINLLYEERPLYRRLIHVGIIFMKCTKKIVDILKF